jgi:probable F420-dependent oxidoreductase
MPLTFGIESQGTSVRAMGDLAALAERAGMEAAWAPELYDRSATISVAEMAHRTSRCRVGTAIAYGVGRSPLTLAAEARDLDEISDGRFVLGIGNGTRRMISDWHGHDPEAPAKRIEELVPLLRDLWLLHERPVDHEGRFYRLRMKPTGQMKAPLRDRIPIWTAGVNPRMIESAGRVADGLLGHALFTAEHIEEVIRPAIARGAAHAERDPAEIAVASLVISVVADDAEQARREAAAQIAFYCSAKTYAALLEANGFGAEGEAIRAGFAAGDMPAMVAAVSDAMVDRMALAGTAAEVRAAARRYEGILDHLILYAPSYGVSEERAVENAAALVAALGGAAASTA